MEVNAQLVIDHLVAQNRQLVAEIALLRAYLKMEADSDNQDQGENQDIQ